MTASTSFLPGKVFLPLSLLAMVMCTTAAAQKSDWPQWGRNHERNMVSSTTDLPTEVSGGQYIGNSEEIDLKTAKNAKWIAKLGSQSYGNPTVADGRVYVGTNNDTPRDARLVGDRCCVYCLDEETGELIWQLNVPKLGTGKVSDWEFLGICSSPAIDGNRVYLVTNLCEVICLDVNGMADGNDGPFQDEGQYMAGPDAAPLEVTETDADIIWVTNMIDELGVFPHNITSCSVMVVGDRVWTSTSNGVDYGHVETPAPRAPCLIVLDKNTGEILGEEASGLSQRILHSNWSSPAYLKTDDQELAIFGGPDGVLYAFRPEPIEDADGFKVLELAWSYDCNPAEYRFKDGKPIKYATTKGPSEVLATPVIYQGRIYAVIGQDPEHGEGRGNMVCVDADGNEVWSYQKINRSMSTMAISDGLVFATDYSGFLYCLDAETGEEQWIHDTAAHIWGSPLVADGRVFIGTEDGFLTIVPATREYDKSKALEIDFMNPVYSSPIAANGVLYITTHTHLFAFAKPAK